MMQIRKNKIALSTVVTTLIILVASSLGAGAVTLCATEITNARTQIEQLELSDKRVWVMSNGISYGAIVIDNVGSKDAVINSIQVRGVVSSWNNVEYLRISTPFMTALNPPNVTVDWSNFNYTGSSSGSFSVGNDALPLKSGSLMVVYISKPHSINLRDIGTTIGITVITTDAQYYAECNVQAVI